MFRKGRGRPRLSTFLYRLTPSSQNPNYLIFVFESRPVPAQLNLASPKRRFNSDVLRGSPGRRGKRRRCKASKSLLRSQLRTYLATRKWVFKSNNVHDLFQSASDAVFSPFRFAGNGAHLAEANDDLARAGSEHMLLAPDSIWHPIPSDSDECHRLAELGIAPFGCTIPALP
jgi:hypothetical protein